MSADDRRLPTWRPGAFEWRNQRKAALIFERQCCAQLSPLFLSWATRSQSRPQWPRHPVGRLAGWVSGYSTPCAATRTKRRWDESGSQTASKSNVRSDPTSNDLQRTRARGHPVSIGGPSAAPGALVAAAWAQVAAASRSRRHARPWPTVAPFAPWFQPARRPAWASNHFAGAPTRAFAVHPPVDCCPWFACGPFSRMRHCFIKGQ